MSYQVLARKWRPKNFAELMGQEHVVTILANALAQNRLHHAYLFTGTRGVGKTTIARIFAKSLNCVEGVTAQPCGICDACVDIDQGNFVDLLEIDAASRTKVDDTREILDNVQYAPSRGRFKVYLIDEVHMLSRSSFNALLKTLEEPPEHVKFILATTDPQKLPITVLSRCLQFHLKALTTTQIETKLADILSAEQVNHESGALKLLAKAARGSMRDSLSLTDQAIAQGQGSITLANLQHMLGSIDQNWTYKILIALLKQQPQGVMEISQEIASYSPSYSRLFAELIQLLHQVAMYQVVVHDFNLIEEHAQLLEKFAQAMSPEDVQLYYQIAVNGRKDLPYAGDEQAAFDMTLLRMLAFKPVANANALPQTASVQQEVESNLDFEQVKLPAAKVEAPATPEVQEVEPATEPVSEQAMEQMLASEVAEIEQEAHLLQHAQPPAFEEPQINGQSEIIEQQVDQFAPQPLVPQQLPSQEITTQPEQGVQPQTPAFDNVQAQTAQANESHPYQQEPQTIESAQLIDPVQQVESEHNVAPAQASVDTAPTQLDSPIQSVIQQRNMLRSRKKKQESSAKKSDDAASRQISVAELQQKAAQDVPALEQVAQTPYTPEVIDPSVIRKANQVDKWANMIDAMALNGRLRQMAINATISSNTTDEHIVLCLNQKTKHLKTEAAHQQLIEFVSHYFNQPMQVSIEIVEETVDDPFQIQSQINDKRYDYAKELLYQDDIVQRLQNEFQAELDESTVSAR